MILHSVSCNPWSSIWHQCSLHESKSKCVSKGYRMGWGCEVGTWIIRWVFSELYEMWFRDKSKPIFGYGYCVWKWFYDGDEADLNVEVIFQKFLMPIQLRAIVFRYGVTLWNIKNELNVALTGPLPKNMYGLSLYKWMVIRLNGCNLVVICN